MAKKVSKQVADVVVENSAKKLEAKVSKVVDKKVTAENKKVAKNILTQATDTVVSWFKKGNTIEEKVVEVKASVEATQQKALENLKKKYTK
jgi:hypothetical protein